MTATARRRPSPRLIPFRARLTLGFAGALILLFGGLALVLHTLFSNSLDQSIDRSLHTRADDLAALLRGQHELPVLPESGGGFAQIIDPRSSRVVAATPGYFRPLLGPTELRRATTGWRSLSHGGRSRLLAGPVAIRPPAVLVVGVSLAERNGALRTLDDLLFFGGPVLLVLTCLAGYGLAARALAPVERMRAQADRISGGPAGERLPVPDANDELHRLGETLNEMLSRLEVALERERAFVADAGHELRTPLAILKLELELALSSDGTREDLLARLRSVAEEVERLDKLAQDLLVIARAEQGRLPLERENVELRELLRRVAGRFATATRSGDRVVTWRDPGGLTVDADPVRLEQALTNMVSNALRHGDGTVTLTSVAHDGTVEVHVLDEGSGFAPEFLPRAFERFSRADPARRERGAGLGLSIVRVIAEAHGGRTHARNRPPGGADVWLELPADRRSISARPSSSQAAAAR